MKKSTVPLDLNSPERFLEIRSTIKKKSSLRSIYLEVYKKYAECIKRCPPNGVSIEIGSGAGFVKEIMSYIITSDVIGYTDIDRVMDATRMDFPDNSLSCICMFNVLHHIANIPSFFRESIRCLLPGGRIFMVEPYPGWISTWVFRYLHHEGFDMKTPSWIFESHGPVSDANNALPFVIFQRDIEKFRKEFSELTLLRFEPHTPLSYWLTGGLKKWSLLPQWSYNLSSWVDKKLVQISPRFGSFVDIELIKK